MYYSTGPSEFVEFCVYTITIIYHHHHQLTANQRIICKTNKRKTKPENKKKIYGIELFLIFLIIFLFLFFIFLFFCYRRRRRIFFVKKFLLFSFIGVHFSLSLSISLGVCCFFFLPKMCFSGFDFSLAYIYIVGTEEENCFSRVFGEKKKDFCKRILKIFVKFLRIDLI